MKWFLNIAIILFVGLLIFNISQLNFNDNLLSEENKIFSLSGMFAIVGLLLTSILYFFRKIAGFKTTK